MADPATLLRVGRQALQSGKIDQAITILTAATTALPDHALAWFSLATAHAKKGQQDAAALAYFRARIAAKRADDVDPRLVHASHDNMVLASEKVLPRDWLPALNDVSAVATWQQALSQLAASLVTKMPAEDALTPSGPGQCSTPQTIVCYVAGGLGIQALQLAASLQQCSQPGCTGTFTTPSGPSDGPSGPAEKSVTEGATSGSGPGTMARRVITSHSNDLELALCSHLAAVNRTQLGHVEVVPELQAKAQDQLQPGSLLVAADVCASKMPFGQLAVLFHKFAGLLTEDAVLCPSAITIRAALAEGQDLVNMNEVDVEGMREDTGLDYSACNELLWRHYRGMQVDKLKYRWLSEPVELFRLETKDLLLQIQGQDLPAMKLNPLSPGPRDLLDQACEVVLQSTAEGRLDCLVCWLEYELAPGMILSFAPQSLQQPEGASFDTRRWQTCGEGMPGTSSSVADLFPPWATSALLQPHIWQRVHFFPMKSEILEGLKIVLDVKLSGDNLRVELDEDCLAGLDSDHTKHLLEAMGGLALPLEGCPSPDAGSLASSGHPDDANVEEDSLITGQRAAAGIVSGAPGCNDPRHTHQHVDGDGPEHEQQGIAGLEEDVAGGASGNETDDGSSSQGSPRPPSMLGAELILPYHINMLNDRDRTIRYRDGIQGLVCRMMSSSSESSSPPVILDVGTGTGLLSMLACKAGATRVVGCERELALAMTACTLAANNGCSEAIHVAQCYSHQLAVGPAGQLPRPARLVVHEIFGTDPLSEHILPTMRQVKAELVSEDVQFMPSAFRVIAAAAHSEALPAVYYGMDRAVQASGLNLLPLQQWAPWKVECELLQVPDLLLLSVPQSVLHFDLAQPVALQGQATTQVTLCGPTPVSHYADTGSCLPLGGRQYDADGSTGLQPSQATQQANCLVYWFEADCGEGGWLSTAPGHTYYGHWAQSVQFLEQPRDLACADGCHKEGSAGIGDEVAVTATIEASFVLDRVKVQLLAN